MDEPTADDSKGNKKNKERRGNRGGSSSSDYTTNSGECDTDEPTPTPGTVGSPTVSVTNSTSGTYTVSWSAASNMDTSGPGQQGYELLEYKNGSFVKTYHTSPTTRTQSISNNPDGNYKYKVRGCNTNYRMGVPVCGNYSSLSSVNYVRHKPSKAQAPTVADTSITNGNISISWQKPTGTVTEYDVIEYKSGVSGYDVVANNTTAKSLSLSNRSNGDYSYRVRACNEFSWACAAYSSHSDTAKVRYVPSKPLNLLPTSDISTGSVVLNWGRPSGTINHYRIQKRKNGGSWSKVNYSHANTSITVSGLSDGSWDFRVKSCNDYYWACSGYSYSSDVTVRLKPSTPSAPDTSPSESLDGSIDVTWSKPSGTVTKYDVIEYLSGSRVDDEAVGDTEYTSASLVGRLDGDYTYRVRACNEYDWACSSYSGHSAAVTVNHPIPDTPPSISVPSLVTKDNYSISWGASTSNFTDQYQVSQKHEAGSWSGWTSVSGTNTMVTVDEGGLWTHKVRACNVLPDDSRKCSNAKISSEVDVKLPPDWGRVGGVVPDATYIPSTSLNSDQTVGALEGSGGVSGGAATYSIPIVIPPGRKGMQPSVSLNYSSRSGNGIAGVGWSVSAGSSIHRCGATAAQDGRTKAVTYGTEDKLCLDGQRLIAVNGSTYGVSGAEYRTELDSFARITQSGDIDSGYGSFTVEFKNGRVSRYGTQNQSRHKAGGRAEVLTWAIESTQDPSGNTITYDYYHYPNGENLLQAIHYTGVDGSDGNRHVRFIYESRPDQARSYLAGGLTVSTKRLQKIQTQYQSQTIREYKLFYTNSQHTKRSLLSSVQECASGVCLKPTVFDVYNNLPDWDSNDSSNSANQAISEVGDISGANWVKPMDLNGDGLPEVLFQTPAYDEQNNFVGYTSNIFTRDNQSGDFVSVGEPDNGAYLFARNIGDLNGDGIKDQFVTDSYNRAYLLQFDSSFKLQTVGTTNITMPESFEPHKNWGKSTLQILDLNGDGYQDFLFVDDSYKVQGYFNRANGELEFDGPYNLTTLQQYHYDGSTKQETPSYRDIDGDGVIDVVRIGQNNTTSNIITVDFGKVSSYGRWVVDETRSANGLGLPSNLYHNQHIFADLNGDGLSDFVRPVKTTNGFDWRIRENKGNRTFDTERSLGTGAGIHEDNFLNENLRISKRVQSLWGNGLRIADIDNDGADELLVATGSDDHVCVNFTGNPNATGDFEPYSIRACGDDLHGTHAYENHLPEQENPRKIQIDWARYDTRRFKWSILDFKQSTNGPALDREIPNVVQAPISTGKVLPDGRLVTGSGLELEDVDNNGVLDFSYSMLTAYHIGAKAPNSITVGGKPYYNAILSMNYQSDSPAYAEGYYQQKNLMGLETDQGKLADSVYQVTDGLGRVQEWEYTPLSRWLTGRASTPFYEVPENRYINWDGNKEHFYFTSSMYVVSESKKSTGLKDSSGEDIFNTNQYSYKEAIYNRAGRGFQGFRTIIVDNLASGIRSVSDFHQKFPLAGKLDTVRTCLSDTTDPECEYNPISMQDYDWRIWRNGYISNQELATEPNSSWTVSPGARYGVAPFQSLSKTYDLNNGAYLYSNLSETSVNGYGNVTFQRKTYFEDEIAQSNKVIKEIDNSYYVADETNWSINLLKTKTVTARAVQNIDGEHAPVASGTNTTKSVKTTYVYNDERLPETITTTPVQGGGQSSSVGITYTAYGLPKTVTTLGKHASGTLMQARTVSTTYSSDGYFPKEVTNAKGHKTTTVIDAAHGQPLSVTDANGVLTTNGYDAFGRLISTTTDGAPTIYKGYKWCSGVNNGSAWCPSNDHAVYRVTQVQAGNPTVHRYFDRLNREVTSLTRNFQNTNWLREHRRYDERGLLAWESKQRDVADDSAYTYTYYDSYDALGRLLEKRTPQANGGHLSTSYYYDGLVTEISAGSLSMKRKYNGLSQLVWTEDAMQGMTRYAYDGAGNPISLQDANSHTIHAWHNALGHKTKVNDPNMGIKTFGYNTFGEVELETDANGDTLTMDYDVLGRLTNREINSTLQASFSYDSRPNGKGLLASESAAGINKLYSYDESSRPKTVKTTIDGVLYTTTTEYDANYGRLKALTYPSGIKVAYDYTDTGYLLELSNARTGYSYQKKSDEDAYGNVTEATLANETLSHSADFHPATGQMTGILVRRVQGASPLHQIRYQYNDEFSNLTQQVMTTESGAQSTETYDYDPLHRLTLSVRNLYSGNVVPAVSYSYDAVGNLISKGDYAGTINYGNLGKGNAANAGPNAVQSILKNGTLIDDYEYDNNGNMLSGDGKTIQYNAFNKPISVSKNGVTSTFEYGADLSRFKQTKGTETTLYIDKLVEINKKGNTTTTKTYIGDVAIVEKEEVAGAAIPSHNIRFVHRDRLGSVVTLTDHNNQILEHRSYDPFGKPRTGDFDDVAIPTLKEAVLSDPHSTELSSDVPFTNRGFTDHEHLDDAELIHMNGRAYDYNLGRFLSVDPFIQAPGNSQSMNPYSYIMNNPMAGTDPSGYKAECEQSLGKGCGDDEPNKERREKRGQGFSQDWRTVYQADNGADIVHTFAVKGDATKVEEIGNQAESEGYELVTGRSNTDGTSVAVYTKTYSGGTDGLERMASYVNKASIGAEAVGLAAAAASNVTIVPHFSPAGGVSSWQAVVGNTAKAGMRINLSGLSATANTIGRWLGAAAPLINLGANLNSDSYTTSEAFFKLSMDSSVAAYAMYLGGWAGLAVGGTYMFMDYHMQQMGGWKNGIAVNMQLQGQMYGVMRQLPSMVIQHMSGAMRRGFNNMYNDTRNGFNSLGREAMYYYRRPEAFKRDAFQLPLFNSDTMR
ncbi:SpvB/TcaC N-terminal domain-containing protein [Kangiella taiwanensis]|uniref:Fibronectin type-III domain-containing protein n=1 Tax=Kangiella taiwanensis TaxID=1079179 RepID=A0ABP8I5S3_9GAMM|nr:SpvB/TcaC N-terminal domain-containing protein [Kangiella taiwanensis]